MTKKSADSNPLESIYGKRSDNGADVYSKSPSSITE